MMPDKNIFFVSIIGIPQGDAAGFRKAGQPNMNGPAKMYLAG